VSVGGQVVAEQVERRLLVLADHDGGELVDLWEHDCVNPGTGARAPLAALLTFAASPAARAAASARPA
jgi:hypothetical protein